MTRARQDELLLGEWACLGLLTLGPAHGFALASRLKPDGDVGRVWSVSRALTYRAIDNLVARGFVHALGEEPGIAGGNRTIMSATRAGRSAFRTWIATPITHLRDVRSELLLKLVLADVCKVDITEMLAHQRAQFAQLGGSIDAHLATDPGDVVALWRSESAHAALRFLDRLLGS